jgi:hypothetical protein
MFFPRSWWVQTSRGARPGRIVAAILKLAVAAVVTPPAGQSDDVDPGPGDIGIINRVHVDTSAGAASFSGIVAGSDGQLLWLLVTGANDLTLLNADGSSAPGNQFSGLGDLVIPAGGSALIYWDVGVGASGAWVML